jgi:hypothetical protein
MEQWCSDCEVLFVPSLGLSTSSSPPIKFTVPLGRSGLNLLSHRSCTAGPCTPSSSLEHRHHHPQPPLALCHAGEPPQSTTSPPKATIRCGLVPSCLSHPRPLPLATLVAGILSAAVIPLHKGPNCLIPIFPGRFP